MEIEDNLCEEWERAIFVNYMHSLLASENDAEVERWLSGDQPGVPGYHNGKMVSQAGTHEAYFNTILIRGNAESLSKRVTSK